RVRQRHLGLRRHGLDGAETVVVAGGPWLLRPCLGRDGYDPDPRGREQQHGHLWRHLGLRVRAHRLPQLQRLVGRGHGERDVPCTAWPRHRSLRPHVRVRGRLGRVRNGVEYGDLGGPYLRLGRAFLVSVFVTDAVGATSSATGYSFTVTAGPSVTAAARPSAGDVGLPVEFL